MTVEDLFGLAVRLAGLTFVVFGVFSLIHVAAALVGLPLPPRYPTEESLAIGAVWLALGAGVIRGADAITRLAYRGRRDR